MAEMRLRLDPWPGEYDSPFQLEEVDHEPFGYIDTSVETTEWKAVTPPDAPMAGPVHFVDGVRRVEARVVLDDESGRIIHGLFGSLAAGSVCVHQSRASYSELRIKRYIVAGNGALPETQSFTIGKANITFDPHSISDVSVASLLPALQNLMRKEEAAVAEKIESESQCVFVDGPLTFFTLIELPVVMESPTVGVIKRLFQAYLPLPQFSLVRELKIGQRTPLFLIADGRYDRYSWYLRVGSPRAIDHDLAGVLRLEVRVGVGVAKAIQLAELSGLCLPRLAGNSVQDPRAPQNLLPIGALEQELRHRLGDRVAIRRAIENRLYELDRQ
jgi:hypothetical protein